MQYETGDIVKLKKPHPCGSREWEILRVGADFRLKCLGCGRQIMAARTMVEKNTRGLRKPDGSRAESRGTSEESGRSRAESRGTSEESGGSRAESRGISEKPGGSGAGP